MVDVRILDLENEFTAIDIGAGQPVTEVLIEETVIEVTVIEMPPAGTLAHWDEITVVEIGPGQPLIEVAIDRPGVELIEIEMGSIYSGQGGHSLADEGVPLPKQPTINFTGEGVTASDDVASASTVVDVPVQTIIQSEPPDPTGLPEGTWWVDEDSTSTPPDERGHDIQDEGELLPGQHLLNFTGLGVTAVDDPANDRTTIIVPGQATILDEGAQIPRRTTVNFVGKGVTAKDDVTNARTVIDVPIQTIIQSEPPDPTGLPEGTWWVDADSKTDPPSTYGHTIQDEGAPLGQRSSLNFVGTGVTATDDALGNRTIVTIPGVAGAVGGYMGEWNSSTAYPAGSVVSYADITWGTKTAVAAGQPFPSTDTTPPPTTTVPIATNNAGIAPAILVGLATSASSVLVDNTAFTSEVGEPVPVARASNKSGWLKYAPLASGSVTFSTIGSIADTILTMYKYTGTGAFSFTNLTFLASDDDSGGNHTSLITRSVVGGETYYFQIAEYFGNNGSYKFNISGAKPTAVISPWIQLPGGGHVIKDEGISLAKRPNLNFVGESVVVTDDSGTNSTLVTIEGGGGGGYEGTWDAGTDYPQGSIVTYNGGTWGADNDAPVGSPAPTLINLGGSFVPTPTNSVFDAGVIQLAAPATSGSSATVSNSTFTSEVGEPFNSAFSGDYASTRSGWIKYSPLSSGTVTFSTDGSSGDTVLTMYKYTGGPTFSAFSELTYLQYDDDAGAGANSLITRAVVAGETYYFQIGAYNASVMTYKFNIVNGQPTYVIPTWTPLSSLQFSGPWSSLVPYKKWSIVTHNGATWYTPIDLTANQITPGVSVGGGTIAEATDNIANAPSVQLSLPTTTAISTVAAVNSTFVAESNEPNPQGYSNTKSAWVKYVPLTSGTATFSTYPISQYGRNVFTIYKFTGTGAFTSFLELSYLSYNGSYGEVTQAVVAGTTYYIQIGAYQNGYGEYKLTVANAPPTFEAAYIWAQLPGGHAVRDEGAILPSRSRLNFVGNGVKAIDDAANDQTIVNIPGTYLGNWNASTAYLAGSIVTYGGGNWTARTDVPAGGAPGVASFGASVIPIGTDSSLAAAEIQIAAPVTGGESASWDITSFTTETNEPSQGSGNSAKKSAWLKYTPIASGTVIISCVGSSANPYFVMYSYSGPSGPLGYVFNRLTYLSWNTGAQSTLTQAVVGGQTYYIQIGTNNSSGAYTFQIANAPPTYVNYSWVLSPLGHTIQDEGAALTTRSGLNFVGSAVTVSDDVANNRSTVSITGSTIVNGAGAPTAGVGASSDYYLDTTAHVLYGPKTPVAAPEEWVDLTSFGSYYNGSNMLGMKHQFTEAGKVVGIRVMPRTYNAGNTAVGWKVYLYSNTGILLASKDMPTLPTEQWHRIYFDTPIDVAANTTYVPAVHVPTNSAVYMGAALVPPGMYSPSGRARVLNDGVDGYALVYIDGKDFFPWAQVFGWGTVAVEAIYVGTNYTWPKQLGASWSRSTAAVTTGTLAVNAQVASTITLAPGYRLHKITTSAPCRFRLYTTSAKRDGDGGRPVGLDPSGDHGLILEFRSTPEMLAAELSPTVDGFDGKSTPDGIIACWIANTGTAPAAITVTLTWIQTES